MPLRPSRSALPALLMCGTLLVVASAPARASWAAAPRAPPRSRASRSRSRNARTISSPKRSRNDRG